MVYVVLPINVQCSSYVVDIEAMHMLTPLFLGENIIFSMNFRYLGILTRRTLLNPEAKSDCLILIYTLGYCLTKFEILLKGI